MLKVVFGSENIKRKLLTNSSKINNLTNTSLRNVNIFPDLTREEREKRKKLVNERNNKNSNNDDPSKKWVIRGSKLVLLNQPKN